MKCAVGLNDLGVKKAMAFLEKYDKTFNSPFYKLNVAVDIISLKATEDVNFTYELRSNESITGRPETISFLDSELEWVDCED